MELNTYQKQVMRDLSAYMNCVNHSPNLFAAWRDYWAEKDIAVGLVGVPTYNNSIDGVPHVCMKVPTGGGKTFMACASAACCLAGSQRFDPDADHSEFVEC